jgi:hypothetical protein
MPQRVRVDTPCPLGDRMEVLARSTVVCPGGGVLTIHVRCGVLVSVFWILLFLLWINPKRVPATPESVTLLVPSLSSVRACVPTSNNSEIRVEINDTSSSARPQVDLNASADVLTSTRSESNTQRLPQGTQNQSLVP